MKTEQIPTKNESPSEVRARRSVRSVIAAKVISISGLQKKKELKEVEEADRPKRIEKMENIIHTSKGGLKLQQPDPEVMEAIEEEDPRVTYFPVGPSAEFAGSTATRWEKRGRGGGTYYQEVLRLLENRIREDFPDQLVALRGVQVSLNGVVKDSVVGPVLDIVDVAHLGREKDENRIRLLRIDTSSEDEPLEYIGHWLDNEDFREWIQDADRAEDIFPAILVYDPDRIENLGPHEKSFSYGVKDNAEKAIKAAYVLDAPIP